MCLFENRLFISNVQDANSNELRVGEIINKETKLYNIESSSYSENVGANTHIEEVKTFFLLKHIDGNSEKKV